MIINQSEGKKRMTFNELQHYQHNIKMGWIKLKFCTHQALGVTRITILS